jgi:hypothetical protein
MSEKYLELSLKKYSVKPLEYWGLAAEYTPKLQEME